MSFLALLALFSPAVFAFQGTLHSTTDVYPYHLGRPTYDVAPYFSLEVSDKYKFNRNFRFQWKAYELTNAASTSQPESFYGDFREAFFEYRASATFKMRFGINTVNWGVVDINSPSDVVNTEAFFHPLRIFRQGSPMAQFIFGGESFNVEALYIPVQRAPQLPSTDSRWLPRKFLLNIPGQPQTIYLPDGLDYIYDHPTTFDRALNNNYGAKIASHLGKLDLQLTYFEGVAPQPKIQPATVNLVPNVGQNYSAISPLVVAALNYRQRTTGLGFVYALDKFIFRGESAYQASITQDERIQPWNWASVLAAETNVDIGRGSMTIIAELFYTKNPQAADNTIASMYRLFDQTGLVGFRWSATESWTFTGSLLYTGPTKGMFWLLGWTNKLGDHFSWGAQWDNFSADKDGLLKTFAQNSQGTLDLAYYF